MRSAWLACPLFLLVLVAVSWADELARHPVPDAMKQRDALKLLREVFKDDYAKRKPNERAALPAKWLKYAYETKDDAAGQYVLFCQARDQGLDVGNYEASLQAMRDLVRFFEADPGLEGAQVLTKMAATVKTVDGAKAIAQVALLVADDDYAANYYDTGDRVLTAGESAALKSRDLNTLNAVRQRKKNAQTERQNFATIATALKTLMSSPDDAAANLTVGLYECLSKGKWDQGLARLAKGSDADLKEAAARDQAAQDPDSQVKAANAWWAWGQAQQEPSKSAALARAAYWYAAALPNLNGLTKNVADDRLKEYEKAHPLPTKWVVLFRGDDPAAWNTDTNGAQYAIKLDKAPTEIKYLRLARKDSGEAMIMPLTRKQLNENDLTANKPYRWNGTSYDQYGGRHLGIGQGEKLGWLTNKGCIAVTMQGFDPWVGSGFGHMHHGPKDVLQCYCWKGQPIGKTVFEISVTADELAEPEQKMLLR